MNHKYASDSHNHSDCSPDGRSTPQSMIDRAHELGLYAYTLTDHCECNDYEHNYRGRAEKAWEAMEKVKVPEGLIFLRGIELGQLPEDPGAAREVTATYDYDFAIGSIHNIKDEKDFYYIDCRSKRKGEIDSLLRRYWEEELEMISLGHFDALGHLTYPIRYIQGEQGVEVDLTTHYNSIDEIFRSLIKNGKALEVNTSGLWGTLGMTMPDAGLLKRYYGLGGRLLTFGSDAHNTENLGGGIDQAMDTAREIGFKEFTIYRRHKPQMLPLE